jgi:hypothetical protein
MRVLTFLCTSCTGEPLKTTPTTLPLSSAIYGPTVTSSGFGSTTESSSTCQLPTVASTGPFDKLQDLANFSACDLDMIVFLPNKTHLGMKLMKKDQRGVPLSYKMFSLMTQKNRFAIELFNHLQTKYQTDGMSCLFY